MIYELNHVGIVVRDLEASLAFYRRFGARIVFDRLNPGSGMRIVYVQLAQGLVELLFPAPAGHTSETVYGVTHVGFLSDDLDGDHARLVAGGATSLGAPAPAGTGVGRLGFVAGPDGERVEIIQRDVTMRTEAEGHDSVDRLAWYRLAVTDVEASADFYRDAIGLVERGYSENGILLGLDHDELELSAAEDASAGPATPAAGSLTGLVLHVRGDGAGEALVDPDGVPVLLVAAEPAGPSY